MIRLGLAALLAIALATQAMAEPADDAGHAFERGAYAEAAKLWTPLAQAGDPIAQTGLGMIYEGRKGVPADLAQAREWYRKAADQGFALAQFQLGQMYRDGVGVPEDWTEALRWFLMAAEQGRSDAQWVVGSFYAYGNGGIPRDDAKALLWLGRSAEQGNAWGLLDLARMHQDGQGLRPDLVKSLMLYDLASRRSPRGALHDRAEKARAAVAAALSPSDRLAAKALADAWDRDHPARVVRSRTDEVTARP